jgi:hypothetical protein
MHQIQVHLEIFGVADDIGAIHQLTVCLGLKPEEGRARAMSLVPSMKREPLFISIGLPPGAERQSSLRHHVLSHCLALLDVVPQCRQKFACSFPGGPTINALDLYQMSVPTRWPPIDFR